MAEHIAAGRDRPAHDQLVRLLALYNSAVDKMVGFERRTWGMSFFAPGTSRAAT